MNVMQPDPAGSNPGPSGIQVPIKGLEKKLRCVNQFQNQHEDRRIAKYKQKQTKVMEGPG